MTDKPIRICKECTHCDPVEVPHGGGPKKDYSMAICKIAIVTNPVTGETSKRLCAEERKQGVGECGPLGRKWQEKK